MDKYEENDRGIKIIELDGAFQMCTKKEHYETILKITHIPKKHVLTDVLLETLSIVAYKQPTTKAQIEAIRGVNSDHAVNKLVEYNLICELGRLDAPGRPILFGTTEDFLRHFGLQSLNDLPDTNTEKSVILKKKKKTQLKLGSRSLLLGFLFISSLGLYQDIRSASRASSNVSGRFGGSPP